MKLAWATDIHWNMAKEEAKKHFVEQVRAAKPDLLVITGDITDRDWEDATSNIYASTGVEIFFVLGNHDHYGSSWGSVRRRGEGNPHYLTCRDTPVRMGTSVLIGHDSWADGRAGTPMTSSVLMQDWYSISDYTDGERNVSVHRRLGERAVAEADVKLRTALIASNLVVLATHIPPYPQATWHEGNQSGPDWLPWFCCLSMGDMITATMQKQPDKELLVLCGHTHGRGVYSPIPNVRVLTGGAIYGKPEMQGVVDCETLEFNT